MKQHRSLIQYGTFYRLSSPFENNITAWMAVSEDRTEALVGWYRTLNVANVRLRGCIYRDWKNPFFTMSRNIQKDMKVP